MDWMLKRAIAHRGLHSGSIIPENSMTAFGAAIDQNYPIELDVQLLADGQVVVFHDVDLKRMTGHTGAIANQTRDTLKLFRLLGTDQHIPLLSEVLTAINGQVPVLIEIKNEGKAGDLEAAVLEIVSGYIGEFAIQSFNPYSLIWFKKHAPSIVRGQLSSNFKGANLTWLLKMILGNMLLNGLSVPHFIAYDVNALPNLATTIASRVFKRPLLAWTIRSQSDHQRALQYADNIIFDTF